jgi:DNA-binding XRE family transcriptional regulator
MTQEELLDHLERTRLECGLNVTDFAASLGMSYETYYRWKRGKPPKTILTCLDIINFCREKNLLSGGKSHE